MSDLRELYQDQIKEHARKPRNYRRLDDADRQLEGHNPLCGDRFTIYLKLSGGKIQDVAFQGSGCAISTASASMMTEVLKGKTVAEAETLFDSFHELLTGRVGDGPGTAGRPPLGKLAVFSGVREFPVRVKCATLAWHTLHAALAGQTQPISTE